MGTKEMLFRRLQSRTQETTGQVKLASRTGYEAFAITSMRATDMTNQERLRTLLIKSGIDAEWRVKAQDILLEESIESHQRGLNDGLEQAMEISYELRRKHGVCSYSDAFTKVVEAIRARIKK